MEPTTAQDAREQMKSIMQELLPDVLREMVNTVRLARILNVQTDSRSADIQIVSTGEVISDVRMGKGTETNAVDDDLCVIVSDDPIRDGSNYIIAVL